MAKEGDRGVVNRFHSVDQTTNPDFFIKFVDEGNRLETVQTCKKIMSFLNIQQGQSILDVGCGTGDDVLSLAELVGKTGCVVGVDSSENMIEEAKKRSKLRGGNKISIELHVGNAHHLDFADNTFDCSRAERLLMHVDDPSKVIAEMAKVTKPGGHIVIFDLDWGGVIINHNDRTLTRKVIHLMCDSIRNGWIGRQLPSLFKQAGLKSVYTVAHTILPHYTFFIQICDGMMKSAIRTAALTRYEYNQMWDYLERTNQGGNFLSLSLDS